MTQPTATHPRRSMRHLYTLLTGFAAAAVLVTGCQAGSPRGELGENQQLLAQCDPSAPPASLVQIDGTGSSASDAILNERLRAIKEIVRRTAICSGYLKVVVFSASSAAATALFDGPLKLEGATANARLKQAREVVDNAMNQIRKAYGPAVAGLPGGGSDITAQYRLAAEWMDQLDDAHRLALTIFTDGFQTFGVDLGARALSRQEAIALADRATVPKLAGASVVVAGLGRVAGNPPLSTVVEGLVAYYDRLCERTGAARCVSVTDYTAAGR